MFPHGDTLVLGSSCAQLSTAGDAKGNCPGAPHVLLGLSTGRKSPQSFNVTAEGVAVTAGQPPDPNALRHLKSSSQCGNANLKRSIGIEEVLGPGFV